MDEIWDILKKNNKPKQEGPVKRYIPKPLEAAKLTPESIAEVAKWCSGEIYHKDADGNEVASDGSALSINTVDEHTATADMGDYIVKTVQGDFYPVRGEAFEILYEQIWWDEPDE